MTEPGSQATRPRREESGMGLPLPLLRRSGGPRGQSSQAVLRRLPVSADGELSKGTTAPLPPPDAGYQGAAVNGRLDSLADQLGGVGSAAPGVRRGRAGMGSLPLRRPPLAIWEAECQRIPEFGVEAGKVEMSGLVAAWMFLQRTAASEWRASLEIIKLYGSTRTLEAGGQYEPGAADPAADVTPDDVAAVIRILHAQRDGGGEGDGGAEAAGEESVRPEANGSAGRVTTRSR
jgi:hypothetical protein